MASSNPTGNASPRPATFGELKASGWRRRSVKQEMRENLVSLLRRGEPVFPGVVGYDKTVVPQICNAVLSAHDFILLGLRGQAKTRILRALPRLLDDAIPIVAGSEVNDDPFAPISEPARRLLAERGDDTPIEWVAREERYREKLATPDVTIADLIGDIDPIKAATRKLTFADPDVIHFGIVPRTNRGIFAINEVPDLQARIQVGLLNILEEGDIQIRGFPVRMPLDMCLVFSANPEDYTNRGNIITPLRDRIASQIITHYPGTVEEAGRITQQEAWTDRGEALPVTVPEFVRTIVEEVAFQARSSEFVDQNSGVSARVPIALMENVVSNAERRALLNGLGSNGAVPRPAVARVADVLAALPAITGKVELVYEGEREGVLAVARHLVGKAVKAVFDGHFPDALTSGSPGNAGKPGGSTEAGEYRPLLDWFRQGNSLDVSDEMPAEELLLLMSSVPGLRTLTDAHLATPDDEQAAAAMELVLEGLHQSSLLAKQEVVGGRVYCDVFDEMARSLND